MKEYWTNGMATLYQADARVLPLPDKSVHMCVTSPPYWGLRDYGLGQWEGGDAECGHVRLAKDRQKEHGLTDRLPGTAAYGGNAEEPWPNGVCGHCGARQQAAGIGLEPTLGEWVANIVAVMREVRRVLRDDGTLWLNLGDAYTSGNRANWDTGKSNNMGHDVQHKMGRQPTPEGLKPKDLMGQPWRVAFALQDDGWILRSAIVWHKPNPMPESVRDRPTNAYEMVFLLSKGPRYFYDAEAVRQPSKKEWEPETNNPGWINGTAKYAAIQNHEKAFQRGSAELGGANARNVWTIPTQGRSDAHFATFPDELPRRCILAGTSERGVCADCGAPWVRVTDTTYTKGTPNASAQQKDAESQGVYVLDKRMEKRTQTLGWQPTCGCNADTVPATVLDPFAGSGTTLAVAQSLGRKSVGTDLNPEYLEIARRYISKADGITLSLGL